MTTQKSFGKKQLRRMARQICEIEKKVESGEYTEEVASGKIENITSEVDFEQLFDLDEMVLDLLYGE